ncbi:hypothetical protein LM594_03930 [Candidatus Caldipriscus sp.]|nr:hypothetical protein [Candidatus Caldipriscus sp.]
MDVLLIKTNGNKNLQWAKTYGGTLDNSARTIVQTSDGGIYNNGYHEFIWKSSSSKPTARERI